jgi:hypothetical protein
MARAISSLPVPVSPKMRTVASVGATFVTCASTRRPQGPWCVVRLVDRVRLRSASVRRGGVPLVAQSQPDSPRPSEEVSRSPRGNWLAEIRLRRGRRSPSRALMAGARSGRLRLRRGSVRARAGSVGDGPTNGRAPDRSGADRRSDRRIQRAGPSRREPGRPSLYVIVTLSQASWSGHVRCWLRNDVRETPGGPQASMGEGGRDEGTASRSRWRSSR